MTIAVKCSCGRILNLADDLQGKRVRCPDCSAVLAVPNVGPDHQRSTRSTESGRRRSEPGNHRGSKNQSRQPSPSPKPRRGKPIKRKRRPAPEPETFEDEAWLDASSYESAPYDDDYGASASGGSSGTGRKSSTKKKKSKKTMSPLAIIGIGCGSVTAIGVIGIVILVASLTGDGDTSDLPDAATVVVPESAVPQRLEFRPSFPSGVQLASTQLTGSGPGMATQLIIYRPPGEAPAASLGCVLVAPAGTNLLIGNRLDGPDYHDETLPYAEAGFVAIQYSLDGPVRDLETASTQELGQAYKQFRAAGAGTVNTRCVIEFVRQRIPEVDPSRIYTAGHSSAGTVSLLAAELLPNDVAACIAYAPCSDPEAFHSEAGGLLLNSIFPGATGFDKAYSPINNVASLKCPTFLFQAADDSVVPAARTRRMVEAAKQHNQRVKYVEVPSGDHYQPMIDSGIPQAIQWLQQVDGSLQKK